MSSRQRASALGGPLATIPSSLRAVCTGTWARRGCSLSELSGLTVRG